MGRLVVNIVGAKGYKKEVLRKERYQGERWYAANIPITRALPNGYQVCYVDKIHCINLSSLGLVYHSCKCNFLEHS